MSPRPKRASRGRKVSAGVAQTPSTSKAVIPSPSQAPSSSQQPSSSFVTKPAASVHPAPDNSQSESDNVQPASESVQSTSDTVQSASETVQSASATDTKSSAIGGQRRKSSSTRKPKQDTTAASLAKLLRSVVKNCGGGSVKEVLEGMLNGNTTAPGQQALVQNAEQPDSAADLGASPSLAVPSRPSKRRLTSSSPKTPKLRRKTGASASNSTESEVEPILNLARKATDESASSSVESDVDLQPRAVQGMEDESDEVGRATSQPAGDVPRTVCKRETDDENESSASSEPPVNERVLVSEDEILCVAVVPLAHAPMTLTAAVRQKVATGDLFGAVLSLLSFADTAFRILSAVDFVQILMLERAIKVLLPKRRQKQERLIVFDSIRMVHLRRLTELNIEVDFVRSRIRIQGWDIGPFSLGKKVVRLLLKRLSAKNGWGASAVRRLQIGAADHAAERFGKRCVTYFEWLVGKLMKIDTLNPRQLSLGIHCDVSCGGNAERRFKELVDRFANRLDRLEVDCNAARRALSWEKELAVCHRLSSLTLRNVPIRDLTDLPAPPDGNLKELSVDLPTIASDYFVQSLPEARFTRCRQPPAMDQLERLTVDAKFHFRLLIAPQGVWHRLHTVVVRVDAVSNIAVMKSQQGFRITDLLQNAAYLPVLRLVEVRIATASTTDSEKILFGLIHAGRKSKRQPAAAIRRRVATVAFDLQDKAATALLTRRWGPIQESISNWIAPKTTVRDLDADESAKLSKELRATPASLFRAMTLTGAWFDVSVAFGQFRPAHAAAQRAITVLTID